MKVVSFKVDLRTYKEIVEAADGESVAGFTKRIVLEFIGRPTVPKVDLQNEEITGRERQGQMVDAYHREPDVDPEKLKKFKEKWGR